MRIYILAGYMILDKKQGALSIFYSICRFPEFKGKQMREDSVIKMLLKQRAAKTGSCCCHFIPKTGAKMVAWIIFGCVSPDVSFCS